MKKSNLLFIGLIALATLVVSCNKNDNHQIPFDGKTYDVSFSPLLNGNVVPWLSKPKTTKGYAITHDYYSHVVRIYTIADVWVADLPIVEDILTQGLTYPMSTGNYYAVVIPVTDNAIAIRNPAQVAPNNAPYSIVDLTGDFYTQAPFYTTDPVTFNVVGNANANVILNCITDFGCVVFDLNNTDQSIGPVPRAQVSSPITDVAFLGMYGAILPNHTAPFLGVRAVGLPAMQTTWQLAAMGSFLYIIPGNFATPVLTRDFGGTDQIDIQANGPHYLGFDLTNGGVIPESMPVIWLRDWWTNVATMFTANSTIQVGFATGGSITVNQLDWFGNTVVGEI
jgi:hypothetical protein